MTLAIGFKGSEGLVLAADSRVTLQFTIQPPGQPAGGPVHTLLIPATYDNATKLLKVEGQNHVAAVTFNAGAIGTTQPRTAHSLLPEFEAQLGTRDRLATDAFASHLSAFFLDQWTKFGGTGDSMDFIVGGYDDGDPYGRLFSFAVPNAPQPVEQHKDDFGIRFGGQHEVVSRVLNGYDGPLGDDQRQVQCLRRRSCSAWHGNEPSVRCTDSLPVPATSRLR